MNSPYFRGGALVTNVDEAISDFERASDIKFNIPTNMKCACSTWGSERRNRQMSPIPRDLPRYIELIGATEVGLLPHGVK
jgi:hypothetical protein